MDETKKVKAYKVFNKDWTCRGYQYKLGETPPLIPEDEISMCSKGYHACLKLVDCFNYYSFNPEKKVAEVLCEGKIIQEKDNDKICCSKITVIKEISWQECLEMVNCGEGNSGLGNTGYSNTGNRNTGYRNTGNRNTGNWNTGDNNTGNRNTGDNNTGYSNTGNRNTGNWNTGYRNTGDNNTGYWNSCNKETGSLNSKHDIYIRIFNKRIKKSIWELSIIPQYFYFNVNKWVKNDTVSEGTYEKIDYKKAWIESFNDASIDDVKLTMKLPNFSYKVFEELSGITRKMIQTKLKGE